MIEQTKECSLCGLTKPFSEFRKHTTGRFGLTPRCKGCLNPQNRAYYRANPEIWKNREIELRTKDPEGLKKKNRDAATRWRANPENRSIKRLAYIEKRYGLTIEQYDEMELRQNGLCAICGGPPTGRYNRLHVDHNHVTGKVRGLLCFDCNVLLGKAKDDPIILQKAHIYLQSQSCSPYRPL